MLTGTEENLIPAKSDNLLSYLEIIFYYPPQGTAVFWYNLFASGEGDYSTRHAACPVLVGNKWGKYFLYSLVISPNIERDSATPVSDCNISLLLTAQNSYDRF